MTRRPIPILLYHSIDIPPPSGLPFRGLWVHPQRFRGQMYWLKRLGFQGLSMRDALPYLQGGKQGKVAIITFDDGFLNVYQNALPVLQELGFTATNYFVANQLGHSNKWDHALGIQRIDCMTTEQMREWAALGHEVGSHTLDHVHLPQVSRAEAQRQIEQSKLVLEDLLGSEVTNFCYPYGGETPELRDIVRNAGYSYATTTERRLARTSDDPFGLPRRTIRRSDLWPQFLKKLYL